MGIMNWIQERITRQKLNEYLREQDRERAEQDRERAKEMWDRHRFILEHFPFDRPFQIHGGVTVTPVKIAHYGMNARYLDNHGVFHETFIGYAELKRHVERTREKSDEQSE
jgi:hypothetical protein